MRKRSAKTRKGRDEMGSRPTLPVVIATPCTREQALSQGRTGSSNLETIAFWRAVRAGGLEPDQLDALRSRASRFRASSVRARASKGIAEALKYRKADALDVRFDEAMTELLVCAFEDAAAALVLSNMLRAAPIDRRKRASLAASWSAYGAGRASRKGTSSIGRRDEERL